MSLKAPLYSLMGEIACILLDFIILTITANCLGATGIIELVNNWTVAIPVEPVTPKINFL